MFAKYACSCDKSFHEGVVNQKSKKTEDDLTLTLASHHISHGTGKLKNVSI